MGTFREEVKHEILVAASANPVFVTVGPAHVEVGPRGVFVTYHGGAYAVAYSYDQRFSLTTTEFSFNAYDDLARSVSVFEFTEFSSLTPGFKTGAGTRHPMTRTAPLPNGVEFHVPLRPPSMHIDLRYTACGGGGGGGFDRHCEELLLLCGTTD